MSTTIQFTLSQYDRMIQQGVFAEMRDRQLELIRGEVREMSPPGPTHEEVIDLLTRWSVLNLSPRGVRIRIQNSIGVAALDSAPQPDVAWVRERSYRDERPEPADVHLIIEVADSSLAFDRGEKLELYAEAGIPEYWVVNIPHWQVEVYREPRGRRYGDKAVFGLGQAVRPAAFPDLELSVSYLFGK
jgi:Uma2 family endonuclease